MTILVTQRVEASPFGERRDALDQRWTEFLEFCDLDWLAAPNKSSDIVAWAQRREIKGVLLTGGNDLCLPGAVNTALERDETERALLDFAKENFFPVLGVCRGMQMINSYLGGSLQRIVGHCSERHRLEPTRDCIWFDETTEKNSFHNWGITASDLAPGLKISAVARDDVVEAFRHSILPWFGIMWHPERDDPFGEPDKAAFFRVFGASRS
jgi:N5-(cytidine 5'-diphosphoramidyl)-L-glutamine hydrolase